MSDFTSPAFDPVARSRAVYVQATNNTNELERQLKESRNQLRKAQKDLGNDLAAEIGLTPGCKITLVDVAGGRTPAWLDNWFLAGWVADATKPVSLGVTYARVKKNGEPYVKLEPSYGASVELGWDLIWEEKWA